MKAARKRHTHPARISNRLCVLKHVIFFKVAHNHILKVQTDAIPIAPNEIVRRKVQEESKTNAQASHHRVIDRIKMPAM